MSNIEIGDWKPQVSKHPIFDDNVEALHIVIERLEGQYLPALKSARDNIANEKVWLALWTYLTSRLTIRKPFQLTYSEADKIIDIIQSKIKYI